MASFGFELMSMSDQTQRKKEQKEQEQKEQEQKQEEERQQRVKEQKRRQLEEKERKEQQSKRADEEAKASGNIQERRKLEEQEKTEKNRKDEKEGSITMETVQEKGDLGRQKTKEEEERETVKEEPMEIDDVQEKGTFKQPKGKSKATKLKKWVTVKNKKGQDIEQYSTVAVRELRPKSIIKHLWDESKFQAQKVTSWLWSPRRRTGSGGAGGSHVEVPVDLTREGGFYKSLVGNASAAELLEMESLREVVDDRALHCLPGLTHLKFPAEVAQFHPDVPFEDLPGLKDLSAHKQFMLAIAYAFCEDGITVEEDSSFVDVYSAWKSGSNEGLAGATLLSNIQSMFPQELAIAQPINQVPVGEISPMNGVKVCDAEGVVIDELLRFQGAVQVAHPQGETLFHAIGTALYGKDVENMNFASVLGRAIEGELQAMSVFGVTPSVVKSNRSGKRILKILANDFNNRDELLDHLRWILVRLNVPALILEQSNGQSKEPLKTTKVLFEPNEDVCIEKHVVLFVVGTQEDLVNNPTRCPVVPLRSKALACRAAITLQERDPGTEQAVKEESLPTVAGAESQGQAENQTGQDGEGATDSQGREIFTPQGDAIISSVVTQGDIQMADVAAEHVPSPIDVALDSANDELNIISSVLGGNLVFEYKKTPPKNDAGDVADEVVASEESATSPKEVGDDARAAYWDKTNPDDLILGKGDPIAEASADSPSVSEQPKDKSSDESNERGQSVIAERTSQPSQEEENIVRGDTMHTLETDELEAIVQAKQDNELYGRLLPRPWEMSIPKLDCDSDLVPHGHNGLDAGHSSVETHSLLTALLSSEVAGRIAMQSGKTLQYIRSVMQNPLSGLSIGALLQEMHPRSHDDTTPRLQTMAPKSLTAIQPIVQKLKSKPCLPRLPHRLEEPPRLPRIPECKNVRQFAEQHFPQTAAQFRFVFTKGGGNCLPHAIALGAFGSDSPEVATTLRYAMAQWVASNLDSIADCPMVNNDVSVVTAPIDELVSLASPQVYLTGVSCFAAAEVLRCRIRLHNINSMSIGADLTHDRSDSFRALYVPRGTKPEDLCEMPTLDIAYVNEVDPENGSPDHYVYMEPKRLVVEDAMDAAAKAILMNMTYSASDGDKERAERALKEIASLPAKGCVDLVKQKLLKPEFHVIRRIVEYNFVDYGEEEHNRFGQNILDDRQKCLSFFTSPQGVPSVALCLPGEMSPETIPKSLELSDFGPALKAFTPRADFDFLYYDQKRGVYVPESRPMDWLTYGHCYKPKKNWFSVKPGSNRDLKACIKDLVFLDSNHLARHTSVPKQNCYAVIDDEDNKEDRLEAQRKNLKKQAGAEKEKIVDDVSGTVSMRYETFCFVPTLDSNELRLNYYKESTKKLYKDSKGTKLISPQPRTSLANPGAYIWCTTSHTIINKAHYDALYPMSRNKPDKRQTWHRFKLNAIRVPEDMLHVLGRTYLRYEGVIPLGYVPHQRHKDKESAQPPSRMSKSTKKEAQALRQRGDTPRRITEFLHKEGKTDASTSAVRRLPPKVQSSGESLLTVRASHVDQLAEFKKLVEGQEGNLIVSTKQNSGEQPMFVLGSDYQFENLARFSCSNSFVIGMDRTFGMSTLFVSTIVYQHPNLMRNSTKDNPWFLGPVLLHREAHTRNYVYFLTEVKDKMRQALARGDRCEQVVFSATDSVARKSDSFDGTNVCTDGERAMINAVKDVFSRGAHIQCRRHIREATKKHLQKSRMRKEVAEEILNQLFDGKESLQHTTNPKKFEKRWDDLVQYAESESVEPSVVKYLRTVAAPLEENVGTDLASLSMNYTNNAAEGINNLLRTELGPRPGSILECYEAIKRVIEHQEFEMRNAVIGRKSEFTRLTKGTVPANQLKDADRAQQDRAYNQFLKQYANASGVSSSKDGTVTGKNVGVGYKKGKMGVSSTVSRTRTVRGRRRKRSNGESMEEDLGEDEEEEGRTGVQEKPDEVSAEDDVMQVDTNVTKKRQLVLDEDDDDDFDDSYLKPGQAPSAQKKGAKSAQAGKESDGDKGSIKKPIKRLKDGREPSPRFRSPAERGFADFALYMTGGTPRGKYAKSPVTTPKSTAKRALLFSSPKTPSGLSRAPSSNASEAESHVSMDSEYMAAMSLAHHGDRRGVEETEEEQEAENVGTQQSQPVAPASTPMGHRIRSRIRRPTQFYSPSDFEKISKKPSGTDDQETRQELQGNQSEKDADKQKDKDASKQQDKDASKQQERQRGEGKRQSIKPTPFSPS